MNAIIIFFAILLISISAYAQPTNNVAPAEKPSSSNTTEVTKEPAGKSGKVVVPPEKLRPIVIPITESEVLKIGRAHV